jgi:cytochrome P450
MADSAGLPPLAPFDPIDPNVMECPYPHFGALREEAPVHRVPNADYYVVSRYQDVQDILRRHADFSSDLTPSFEGMGVGSPFIPSPVLNLSDPPVHTRTKPIAVRAFGPGRIKVIEPKIRGIVDGLIDGFIDKGEVELLKEFALPLPMTIIAGELGIPLTDLPLFKHWSDQMLVFNNAASTPEQVEAAKRAIEEANVYFRALFHKKRANPESDVMSILATATTEPDEVDAGAGERPRPMTDDEALSMIQLILVGGNETTTNAILNAMLLLMQNPGVMRDLRKGKASVEGVIEESLRLESPVRGFWRIATRDTEVSGVPIPKGKMLFLSFAAANRDPAHFPQPECLDPSRANAKTHMAFGHGIHICVGFRLARKEIEISLQQLIARLDNIRLTPGKNDLDSLFVPTALVRGVKVLHLTFDKAAG